MQVLQYEPHVQCLESSSPADLSACRPLLQDFPASEMTQIFGTGGQFGVDVKLPVSYADCESILLLKITLWRRVAPDIRSSVSMDCAAQVDMAGDAVRTQWYNIWSTAAAIMFMCVL